MMRHDTWGGHGEGHGDVSPVPLSAGQEKRPRVPPRNLKKIAVQFSSIMMKFFIQCIKTAFDY